MIGFALDTGNEASFSQSSEKLVSSCEPTSLSATDIVCIVKDVSGAELRFGLRRDLKGAEEIVTMNPAYLGEGRAKLVVDSDASDSSEKPFEISISAHFSGTQTPVILDMADPLKVSVAAPGTSVTVDISAFSFKPEFFADDASYLRAQKASGTKVVMAPDHFIPSGMFFARVGGAMPDDSKRPVAYADFAGEIVKCQLNTNSVGGGPYWWALVKTYNGATIDVVMDPRTVDHVLKVGEIVSGRFWMTANVI